LVEQCVGILTVHEGQYSTLVKKYQNNFRAVIFAVLLRYPLYYSYDKTVPNWWDNEGGLSYFGILRPIAME